jgi:hypothetical protein
MKKISLILVIIFSVLSCSARDYHNYKLRETMISSKQAIEIEKLQALDAESSQPDKKYCKSYEKGYGSFTYSCDK